MTMQTFGSTAVRFYVHGTESSGNVYLAGAFYSSNYYAWLVKLGKIVLEAENRPSDMSIVIAICSSLRRGFAVYRIAPMPGRE